MSEQTGCTFFVPGIPMAKGSMRSFPHSKTKRMVTVADNPKLKTWESDVKLFASEAWVGLCAEKDVALIVTMMFYFSRPKSVSARKRPHMTVRPDLDKLVRAVLDGLTGVVFMDDCQVHELNVRKNYADGQPGVTIHVRQEARQESQ